MQIKKTLVSVVRVFTLSGLVVHFALTLLFVSPLNPIKMDHLFLANETIGRYFPQNWGLFAPQPVQSTQSLLVRCLTEEEIPARPEDKLPAEGWQDVSLAHFTQAQRHPISAYERLVRPIQNSLRLYMNGTPALAEFAEACLKGDEDACKTRAAAMKPLQEMSMRTLRRVSSAFCRERWSHRRFAKVALRLRDRDAVPWSQRASGTPKTVDYEVGVVDIDNDVALPGLYLSEAP